jgi:hypothetical protein
VNLSSTKKTWNIIICVFRLRGKCKIYGNSPTAIYHSISSSSRMFSLFSIRLIYTRKHAACCFVPSSTSFSCEVLILLCTAFSKCDFDDLSKMKGMGYFCWVFLCSGVRGGLMEFDYFSCIIKGSKLNL